MDINDIKAGTYLLVSQFWDEILSKPGQPFDFRRHRRGAVLDLNVDDARRLVLAGAVLPHDPANPTHAVNPDGTVVALLPPNPAETGLVISEEHFAVLSEQLGIKPGATSEEFLAAVQQLQAERASASATAAAATEAAERLREQVAGQVDRPKSDRIDDILEWVGADIARATTALEGEKSAKGDKARPQLTSALEEILTTPAGGS